jgi:hypothetical protein
MTLKREAESMSDTKTTPPTTAITDRYGYREALAEVSVDLAAHADRAAAAARSARRCDMQRLLLLDDRGLALV